MDAICECTGDHFMDGRTPQDDAEQDFFNLVHEIVRLMAGTEPLTFALHPEASGTNNEAERSLRGDSRPAPLTSNAIRIVSSRCRTGVSHHE